MAHVLIVGGGVIGLCIAYYTTERGHRVTILDRGDGPRHDSCSRGNAGMIVPSHFIPLAAPGMVGLGLRMMWRPDSPFYVRPRLDPDLLRWGWLFARSANAGHVARSAPVLRDLNLASRTAYEEMADAAGGPDVFELTRKGLLMLCRSAKALDEEAHVAASARTLGIPARVLNPAEAARVDLDVRMDIAGAVYFPRDGHITPDRFVNWLTETLADRGVTFGWSTEVTGWRRVSGDRRVAAAVTSEGETKADEFVIAGGAWSARLAQALGVSLPMQAGKGYSLTLPHPPRLPSVCSILTEARVAITPMGSALRVGGTMEIMDPADAGGVAPARVRGIAQSVPRYYPEFSTDDFRDVPVWSGLRPCSPDGLPYVGRLRRWDNVSAATGHAMMGMSLGPVTGKIMADILSGASPSIPVEVLRPDRFG